MIMVQGKENLKTEASQAQLVFFLLMLSASIGSVRVREKGVFFNLGKIRESQLMPRSFRKCHGRSA